MKPIVVVDRDAFAESSLTMDEQGAVFARLNETLVKDGYGPVLAVKPGARVAVLWPPVPDVGTAGDAIPSRRPLLIFDADAGIEEDTRQRLEEAGYITLMVIPNSRVVLL